MRHTLIADPEPRSPNVFMRRVMAVTVASLALATTAPMWRGSAAARTSSTSAATLVDLNRPGDLRERFNRDLGKTRVVLLVSPT